MAPRFWWMNANSPQCDDNGAPILVVTREGDIVLKSILVPLQVALHRWAKFSFISTFPFALAFFIAVGMKALAESYDNDIFDKIISNSIHYTH